MNTDKNTNTPNDDLPKELQYPASEDIFEQDEKLPLEEEVSSTDNDDEELPGEDLDVPGSELDDADESIGEEDEENNYYSLSDNDDNGED